MTRGDVFFVDFGIPFGSEPGYRRPIIVIQSEFLNEIESGLDYVLKD